MSRSSKSIKNFKIALLGQGSGLVISFIARIIFIRILGSEYLGLNGLFTNILTVLSLAELGVGEAITYSLYKPLAENDNYKCKMLMQLYKKMYIIIGIIILIVGIFVTPFLPYIINDIPSIKGINYIYILFVINTSVSYFFSYKRNLIIADQNRYVATIYRYFFYFLLNIFQIVFLIITRNYIIFLILQIFFTLIENFFISLKANKMYPYLKDNSKIQLDKDSKKEIIKNTKAMMMHKIGGTIVSSTDNILLSKFVGLIEVGLYSNYFLITNALNIIYGQFYSSILASVGNLVVEQKTEHQYKVFQNIDFMGFLVYSFSSVCLLCLFNPFITLWIGKQYTFNISIVLVIVINFYITGMRKSVLTFREASGLFYKDRWKAIIEAIVNLIASIILANKYGTIGVFLGTLISSVSVCVWVEPYVLFKYGFNKKLSVYFKCYFKYLFFTVYLAILSYFTCFFINETNLVSFILKMIICFTVFFVNVLIFYRNNSSFIYYKELFHNTIIKK